MEFRKLGKQNAIDVPVVGLGCNAFGRRIDEKQTKSVIDSAIDNYITFFDTADSYGNGLSEEFIGRAVKGRRNKIVIATKFGWGSLYSGKSHGTRENIRVAIDKSRHRLQTDFIELYQLHKPDPNCPIVETLHALEELVQEGKIGFYGCSNFSASQLTEAIGVASRDGLGGFVTAQNSWSLMDRSIESELLDVCKNNEVGILPYYPLARGLLTGKYRRGVAAPSGSRLGDNAASAAEYDILEKLESFSRARGHDLLTLAVSWLLSDSATCCVISGATRPEQLLANAEASAWQMTQSEREALNSLLV